MKPLIISTSDIKGGAARSAYRLHQGFRLIGIESQMLVKSKSSSDPFVLGTPESSGIGNAIAGLRLSLEGLPLKIYSDRDKSYYSQPWLPSNINRKVEKINPDIINLHWVSAAYLNIENIPQFHKPIIWTFHDMWAFTGGCHYNQGCARYTKSCGNCPQLGSNNNWDLSRLSWHRKMKAWRDLNLTIVTPSKWLAECTQRSHIFKNYPIEVIPYGVDTKMYQPIDRKIARKLLKLPEDKILILFGALQSTSDKRKGFHLLQAALKELKNYDWGNELELVIFGSNCQKESTDFSGFKSNYLGTLNDDLTLALAYSAANIFIAPSVQDNLPNTVMEALACGIPCVAFSIGGMPDMIEHQKNGYLSEAFKVEDLVQGIIWIIENQERYSKLSDNARTKVEREFNLELQAHRYSNLFKEVIRYQNQ